MHELSLAQSILDIVEDYATKHDFQCVNTLRFSFGRLSCIDPKSLEFAFRIQAEGTKAANARLDFDIKPAKIYCFTCEEDRELDHYETICPQCKGCEVILSGGTEELKLVEMDVD
jgi:hydrogenase nickel incorporation protein HypA/HybF